MVNLDRPSAVGRRRVANRCFDQQPAQFDSRPTVGRGRNEGRLCDEVRPTHRITNAVAEGMNSKIMSTKSRVADFRNADNFKTTIDFYCGGLDLYRP